MSFKKGKNYSREEIKSVVGGSIYPCLVRAEGRIVAVCLRSDMNPEAPEIYLNRNGKNMTRDCDLLRGQSTPFPVFLDRYDSQWEFMGCYLVNDFKSDFATTDKHKKNFDRKDIYGVVFLREVECPKLA